MDRRRSDTRPAGTVTFLFTDVEGSSRLWEKAGAAMHDALAWHDRRVRDAIQSNRGHLIKSTGDGHHAAFANPSDGLAAAIDAQRALNAHAWGEAVIRVRMALHTGTAEQRDGDYYGPTLNRAARLADAGHGGQVLLSLATVELVRDHLPDGVTLRDLGEQRLRDLIRPERIFQAIVADLPCEFPPLRTLDAAAVRSNLPEALTSFIGRVKEVAELTRLVAGHRLVMVTGPGGVGKTRLAIHAASSVKSAWPDGVWFVDLAPTVDPALVPKVVAQALGVVEVGSESLAETLLARLKPMRALLILDNCEHLLEACARLVESMLREAPNVRLVATSREPMHLVGEQCYQLGPLSLPGAGEDPDAMVASEAVALFVERARLQRQGYAVTAQSAPAVAELCVRLDGMPLALELAAARVAVLPVEKIVERLNDRFRLLTAGARAALPRHQTLHATIAWSFDLLSEQGRALLARLSIFQGGFTLEAAEEVASGEGIAKDDILDLVSALIAKSLVLTEANGRRYRLLETIRQFARERLQASGEESMLRQRHLDWCLALALRLEPSLAGGPGQKDSLDLLDAEHDNLRAALAWSMEAKESDAALRLCGRLYRFWSRRGYWQEGYAACMTALALPERPGDEAARAKVLLTAGSIGNNVPGAETRALLEKAIGLARDAGDRATEAMALNNLARILDWSEELARARTLLERARKINRELGNRVPELHNMSNLVNVLRRQRDPSAALRLAEDGLAASRALGDRWLEAIFLYAVGRVALDRGDIGSAQRLNEQTLTIARELAMPDWQSFALVKLAFLSVLGGDSRAAAGRLDEAIGICRRFGGRLALSECFAVLSVLASHGNDHEEAARFSGVSTALLGTLSSSDVLDQEFMEPYSARSRAALGHASYEGARSDGHAMRAEGAIDRALAWLQAAKGGRASGLAPVSPHSASTAPRNP